MSKGVGLTITGVDERGAALRAKEVAANMGIQNAIKITTT